MKARFALESSQALRLAAALLILSSAGYFSFARAEVARESILDRKVSSEKEILKELPKVPRLCDAMTVPKERINVGDCELSASARGRARPSWCCTADPGLPTTAFTRASLGPQPLPKSSTTISADAAFRTSSPAAATPSNKRQMIWRT